MCNDVSTCYIINLHLFAAMNFSVRTAQCMMRGNFLGMAFHCAIQTMAAKSFKFIM